MGTLIVCGEPTHGIDLLHCLDCLHHSGIKLYPRNSRQYFSAITYSREPFQVHLQFWPIVDLLALKSVPVSPETELLFDSLRNHGYILAAVQEDSVLCQRLWIIPSQNCSCAWKKYGELLIYTDLKCLIIITYEICFKRYICNICTFFFKSHISFLWHLNKRWIKNIYKSDKSVINLFEIRDWHKSAW